MTIVVPTKRNGVTTADIVSGAPVRGITWQDVSKLSNWVAGRGSQLIPAYCPGVKLSSHQSVPQAHTFFFRTKPHYAAVEREWCITGHGDAVPGIVDVDTGSSLGDAHFPERRGAARPQKFRETLSSQTGSVQTFGLVLTVPGTTGFGADVWIDSISMREVPRVELAEDSNEYGADPTKQRFGQPHTNASLTQLAAALSSQDLGRRASLLQWSVPYEINSSTTTNFAWRTTSNDVWEDVFTLGVPMLGRLSTIGATTATVRGQVLIWVDTGDADVRFTSSVNGNSSSENFTSTAPALETAIDFTIDCEDTSQSDGLQSSTYDLVNCQIRKNTSGTAYCAWVGIWEE